MDILQTKYMILGICFKTLWSGVKEGENVDEMRLLMIWSLLQLSDGYTGGIIMLLSLLFYMFTIFHDKSVSKTSIFKQKKFHRMSRNHFIVIWYSIWMLSWLGFHELEIQQFWLMVLLLLIYIFITKSEQLLGNLKIKIVKAESLSRKPQLSHIKFHIKMFYFFYLKCKIHVLVWRLFYLFIY